MCLGMCLCVCLPVCVSVCVFVCYYAGRRGLVVACLTAVREVPGSNRAAGSCVYHTTAAIYSTVCTFPAVPRSTQPSTLRGTVNEYQPSG